MSQFHLQDHLNQLNERPSRILRPALLAQILGIDQHKRPIPKAELLTATDYELYREEKYVLAVGEGISAPLYLLIPHTDPPHRPIVVFHGHLPSVQIVLGHFRDKETETHYLGIDNNYAQALAQAGYLVAVIEQRGFGERLTDQVGDSGPRSCRHLAFNYMLHGRTLLGERCWDGVALLDYLHTRNDIDCAAIGCTGHSGGGTTALFLAALDQRITVSVVSGYFSSLKSSILGRRHCECNYVPGLLTYGDLGDVAALVAPRPLCFINGRFDSIFPAEGALDQFTVVQRSYSAHQTEAACQLIFHDGGHAYHLPTALAWFKHWLPISNKLGGQNA